MPEEKNVAYFASAAAAGEAGFRPCLRCRPECSPGAPAWAGSSSTVARALRLIAEQGLDENGIDGFAERLGIGARQLRRLFVEHLGAPPVAVAQMQRLLSAKRLINETSLPFTTIAFASGYGSIRRFNAAFLSSYGRCPREIRRVGAKKVRHEFALRFRPPFDWPALCGFFAQRAIPGVEHVSDGTYSRTIRISDQVGSIEVRQAPNGAELLLRINFPDASKLLAICSRVRRMFDLDADPLTIDGHLAEDATLRPLVERRPGLRIPGAWDAFEIGVRAILGQQVAVAAARTLASRLLSNHAGMATFPTPDELLDGRLDRIGLPSGRRAALSAFASAVRAGDLKLDAIADLEDFRRSFCGIPGIGAWTAEYVALRALGDPDAFPAADLVLMRACGVSRPAALEKQAQAWQPWRAYAAIHLWQGVKDGVLMAGHPHRQAAAGGR